MLKKIFLEEVLRSIEERTGLKTDVETRSTCGETQEVMA